MTVRDANDVAACLDHAGRWGMRVALQATGHGAAGVIDGGTLLLDTSALIDLEIDSQRCTARVGAGTCADAVNKAAIESGLVATTGTAPDVGVVGYTLYGGVGWLTRAHGMASASLQAVEFVDASGTLRRADLQNDGDALWAFRGGGGVGVVISIELGLHPTPGIWGGYGLWPMAHLDLVVRSWSELVQRADPELSTVISTLRTPSAPATLGGATGVYFGAASPAGTCTPLLMSEMMESLPPAAVSTFGPCDPGRMSEIHLDPPVAIPALGDGRWLRDGARLRAKEIISAAHLDGEPTLAEVELRHVATSERSVDGALTNPPGEYLMHAVGPAGSPAGQHSIGLELEAVRRAAASEDTGRSAASFRDGQTSAPGALRPADRERLTRIRSQIDSNGVIVVPRPLS